MNVYNTLENRGLIKQITDETIKDRLNNPITVYCGFDPTAESLHIGHLLPIILLKHFEKMGHTPIAVIGGATGCIGDPSFKANERQLNSYDTVVKYSKSLTEQISKFFDLDKAHIVNNMSWTENINIIDFLRDYGKNFTINNMIAKDSVASRMETGISFTEFSYPILQALDFKHLYEKYNCQLQIGGSDQWGNIVGGIDLIRKTRDYQIDEKIKDKVYGITVPLIKKSDGTKFGKTEGGAIWLNPEKTSPYEFYQFFYNTSDLDVINYLKVFTFIEISEITELENDLLINPKARNAQKKLAQEVTKFVHGDQILESISKVSEILFTGKLNELSINEIETNFKGIKKFTIEKNITLIDALINSKLASSKREAREFLKAGSILVNGIKQNDEHFVLTNDIAIGGKYLMIKRGKKKYAFMEMI